MMAEEHPARLVAPPRTTTTDHVEAALFEGIRTGKLTSASPLRLQDLAQQLNVSMMPIREALRRLENIGLVDIVPHRGAWVRPQTVTDLRDTYSVRLLLEMRAVEMASARFGNEHLQRARTALDAFHRARDANDQVTARNMHEAFHFACYEASGSAWLMRSIRPLWQNSERYRIESMRNPEHALARAKEHEELLEALSLQDSARAVEILERHLRSSADLVAVELATDGSTGDAAG